MRTLLSIFTLYYVLACNYDFQLFECEENDRVVFVKPLDCDDKPQVIEKLPCNFSCGENMYLTYDKNKTSLTCLACPSHSYSLGGGLEYSAWNSLKSFKANCWVLSGAGWLLNTNCTSWHSGSDTLLISGSTPDEQWYESDLVFYSNLVKPGYLEVLYRKESVAGVSSSEFFIFINNEIKYFDFTNDNQDWQTAKIPLTKGIKKVQLSFNKLNQGFNSQVFINTIRVSGTRYADLSCLGCEDKDLDAHSRCLICEIGSYLQDNTCKECPSGFSSLPGSKKVEDCFKLPECSDSDYHFYYSDCFEGLQEKIYEWNYPLMCDLNGSSLPEKEIINCTACPPGTTRKSKNCEFCPLGTYSWSGQECLVCPAGKFAEKVQDFQFWTPFPVGFIGKCQTSRKLPCKYDWESRGTHIVTPKVYLKQSRISLEKKVKILAKSGNLYFSYQLFGKFVEFSLFVNKVRVFNQLGDAKDRKKITLNQGENSLEWICSHSTEDEESCQIFHVKITGVDFGGAEQCVDCPEGQVSQGLTELCQVCETGFTADANKSECVACPSMSYSPLPGECKACPAPLIPSKDRESCVVSGALTLNNLTFDTANFTGSESSKPLYCLDQGIECFESFYGPVFSGFHIFYLSVLNPKKVLMPEFFQLSTEKTYIFGLINTTDPKFFQSFQDKQVKKCEGRSEKLLVSLGKEVKNVSRFDENGLTGFDVKYFNGDQCLEDQRFQTSVRFLCSKGEKEGWPVLKDYQNCSFHFEWPTVYACHACADDESQVHKGECKDGKQQVHIYETEQCVLANQSANSDFFQNCNETKGFSTFKIIFAVILLGLLVILALFLCYYLKKAKETYELLIKNKSETLSGEVSTRRGTRSA